MSTVTVWRVCRDVTVHTAPSLASSSHEPPAAAAAADCWLNIISAITGRRRMASWPPLSASPFLSRIKHRSIPAHSFQNKNPRALLTRGGDYRSPPLPIARRAGSENVAARWMLGRMRQGRRRMRGGDEPGIRSSEAISTSHMSTVVQRDALTASHGAGGGGGEVNG